MTYDNWRKYFAEFLEFVRQEIGYNYEIAHGAGNRNFLKNSRKIREIFIYIQKIVIYNSIFTRIFREFSVNFPILKNIYSMVCRTRRSKR